MTDQFQERAGGWDEIPYGFEPAALKTPLENAGFTNIEIDPFAVVTKKTSSGETKTYPLLLVTAGKQ